jgi:hypothetical protein
MRRRITHRLRRSGSASMFFVLAVTASLFAVGKMPWRARTMRINCTRGQEHWEDGMSKFIIGRISPAGTSG